MNKNQQEKKSPNKPQSIAKHSAGHEAEIGDSSTKDYGAQAKLQSAKATKKAMDKDLSSQKTR